MTDQRASSSGAEREPYKLVGAGSSPAWPTNLHRGDGPCFDCGTADNLVWFTDSVFWNAICRSDPDYVEPILCVLCFAKRAARKGLTPHWRLIPEWPWVQEGNAPIAFEATPDTEGIPIGGNDD